MSRIQRPRNYRNPAQRVCEAVASVIVKARELDRSTVQKAAGDILGGAAVLAVFYIAWCLTP